MAERRCPACAQGRLYRTTRRGPLERYLLALFGIYPWRCGACRKRFRKRDRGRGKSYLESGERELPVKAAQAQKT